MRVPWRSTTRGLRRAFLLGGRLSTAPTLSLPFFVSLMMAHLILLLGSKASSPMPSAIMQTMSTPCCFNKGRSSSPAIPTRGAITPISLRCAIFPMVRSTPAFQTTAFKPSISPISTATHPRSFSRPTAKSLWRVQFHARTAPNSPSHAVTLAARWIPLSIRMGQRPSHSERTPAPTPWPFRQTARSLWLVTLLCKALTTPLWPVSPPVACSIRPLVVGAK